MIVVTAPTGMIGHQVVERLLEAGAHVRVVARDPSRIPREVREQVDVVTGSHGEAATVTTAFAGADAVFWLVPPNPQSPSVDAAYLDFTRPATQALVQQGVPRVVGISALGRGTPLADRAGYVTGSLAMDDMITATGVSFRALTMPSFMDNLARQAALIREQGMFASPISGDRRMPTCATRDIATVAAALLMQQDWEGSSEVPVLGPEDLSFDEQAQIAGEVLERPVRYQQLSPDAYKNRMIQIGMSDAMAQGMLDMALAKDAGLDNAVIRTPENSTPTTFREWATHNLRPAVSDESAR